MMISRSLQKLKDGLKASPRMPIVFIGHGSPMNAIEDNDYSRSWAQLGKILPQPQAILVVSAHWTTRGSTLIDISSHPQTIHDFYGFPQKLFDQQYPAIGAPQLAKEVAMLLGSHKVQTDESWGLDHGSWSVLRWLYPNADVPVFQLSIDMTKDLDWHLEMGYSLESLRERGVLILGSGNVVHNLRAMGLDAAPHDWALEFDTYFSEQLSDRNFSALSDRGAMGRKFTLSHPSVDHYLPALTIAGASSARDSIAYMNENIDLGSIAMRSFIFYES